MSRCILSIIMSVVLCVGLMPLPAFAVGVAGPGSGGSLAADAAAAPADGCGCPHGDCEGDCSEGGACGHEGCCGAAAPALSPQ